MLEKVCKDFRERIEFCANLNTLRIFIIDSLDN